MTSTTSIRECPICLDTFRDPVVTPCGHLSCDACIKTHIRASRDLYGATCPTCRAPFPTVWPDMSIVPKKYRAFMMPALRRVYLGDGEDGRTRIDSLNAEVSKLKERVAALYRDNSLLMVRCESAHSSISRLTIAERDARLALNKAIKDARLANQSLETLRRDYQALKSQDPTNSVPVAKRTRCEAALDPSSPLNERPGSDSSPAGQANSVLYNGRPIKPMPKRIKLQSSPTAPWPTAGGESIPNVCLRAARTALSFSISQLTTSSQPVIAAASSSGAGAGSATDNLGPLQASPVIHERSGPTSIFRPLNTGMTVTVTGRTRPVQVAPAIRRQAAWRRELRDDSDSDDSNSSLDSSTSTVFLSSSSSPSPPSLRRLTRRVGLIDTSPAR
ncbi:hypothetical protein BGW80DRAFT_1209904 [Lactifluus volemus]|nr:hypothetical protein BGW80DRAFT_1209904 [Lactifluus volemus]